MTFLKVLSFLGSLKFTLTIRNSSHWGYQFLILKFKLFFFNAASPWGPQALTDYQQEQP
jgi:hypothetical protein